VLRGRIRSLFRSMQRGMGPVGRSDAVAAELLDAAGGPRMLHLVPARAWPLFLTAGEWLSLLDASCERPFAARKPDGSLAFPERAPASWRVGQEAVDAANGGAQTEVNFRVFSQRLAPTLLKRFNLPLSSAAAVWREFFSFIRGGAYGDFERLGVPLSREEYVALPRKVAPSFHNCRDLVFDCYLAYKAMLRSHGAFDAADAAAHVAQQYSVSPLPAELQLEHVFVDEVQDLTSCELALLTRAVKPSGGLFLAGDTAQAITPGVGYRFEDTKAMLFRAAAAMHPSWGTPTLSPLHLNYRATSGCVDGAATIGELMVTMFPAAVDKLPREQGFFAGPPPRMELSTENLMTRIVPEHMAGEKSAFGARQAVLVRDSTARDAILREEPWWLDLGATMLTVEESKGLEFDDVFVVDFFRFSHCDAEWHAISYAALERWDETLDGLSPDIVAGALERRDECRRRCVAFDPLAHARLLSELQLLYVALSRARRRVYVFDRDVEKRAPMYAYLGSPVNDPDGPGTVRPPVAQLEAMDETEEGGASTLLSGVINKAEFAERAARFAQRGEHARAAADFMTSGQPEAAWRSMGDYLAGQAAADGSLGGGVGARGRALLLQAALAYARGGARADANTMLRRARVDLGR